MNLQVVQEADEELLGSLWFPRIANETLGPTATALVRSSGVCEAITHPFGIVACKSLRGYMHAIKRENCHCEAKPKGSSYLNSRLLAIYYIPQ